MFRDVIKSLFYEFCSYFVPQKQNYKISGKCKMCGNCCREIRSNGMKSERDLKLMQFFLPHYRRFYIRDYDENGDVILSCKKLTFDGRCSVYKFRPLLCRNYPARSLPYNAEMPQGCGYIVEKKNFKDYM